MTHWYYIDGPKRVGPFGEREWQELIDSGTIRPETLVWNEDLPGWVPYRALLSDGASGPEGMPPIPSAGSFAAMRAEQEAIEAYESTILEEDYSLSISETFREMWQTLSRHLVTIYSFAAIAGLAYSLPMLVPGLGGPLQMIFGGVFTAALYNLALRCYRGQSTSISDLAIGFDGRYLKHLVIQALINVGIVWGAIFILVVASMVAFLIAAGGEIAHLQERALGGGANFFENLDGSVIAVLALLYLIILSIALFFPFIWFFSVPLIIDKNLSWKESFRISYRKVMQHPWRFGWVISIVSLILSIPMFMIFMVLIVFLTMVLIGSGGMEGAAGGLLESNSFSALLTFLCIATMSPLFFLAWTSMYRKIFTLKRDRPTESPTHD